MLAKVVFIVGTLGVAGYVGTQMSSYDPSIISQPREEVISLLEDARTELPGRSGPAHTAVWSGGRTSDGVTLKMRHSPTAPVLSCRAIIEEISADQSRVVTDCSQGEGGGAMQQAQVGMRTAWFDEHISSTVQQRPFDQGKVMAREVVVMQQGMPAMQQEALQMQAETARAMQEMR